MGAGIALRFSLSHPERVRGLVLAAFPPGARSPEGIRQRSWALAFADAIECDGLEAAGARYAWGSDSGLDAEAARLVKQGFLEHAPHAIAHTLRGLLAVQPSIAELAPELAGLGAPALVVVGGADRVSLGPSRELARALPNACLEVVEGAGHVVNLAARERVNALLRAFLDSLPKPSEGHQLE
jgi:pyruvate dehydrogenase E2 component (dihydrolipoamide acetyltransferase)